MPEKNVREMSKIERMHYSLASRTFHTTIIGAIILGTITLLIGLGLYAYAIFSQTVGQGYGLAQNVNAIVSKVVDITTIEDETMEIYNSYSKEELDSMSHEEYSALFSHIANSDESQQLVSVIADFRDSSEIDDIFYVTFDKENQRMIFLSSYNVGGQGYSIGDYYPVDDKFIDKFTSWNGEGKLYQLSNIKGMGVTCLCGVPVKDAYGTTKGFVLTYLTLNNFVSRMNSFFIQFSATMFVLVNAVAIIFSLYMKKKLVKPINQIAEAAEHYVTDRRQGNKTTNHFSSLNIRTGDEIENLAMIMDDMEKDLVDFEENLTQVTKEKERIGTELALATRIQADMLPNIYPAFPERKEFDIFASMNPAKEVGGDFYDFFLIDDHRLGLVIADVSGKGVPAALFMMVSKILVKNVALTGKSPAETLRVVNEQICSNNKEEMFVTVWLGVLDLQTGILTAANAGHENPIVKKSNGEFEIIKDKHGFVIGGFELSKYKEYEIQLDPGSKLFLYTDGAPEATDANQELFGVDRTLSALNEVKDGSPKEIIEHVSTKISEFVGEAPQFDDLTMLCLHYIEKDEGNDGKIN